MGQLLHMGMRAATAATTAASEESMDRILGLDGQLIQDALILGVNIFILFLVLSYLLFNPARKFLQDRQERVKRDIDTALADKKAAKALKLEYEARLKDIKKEADEIIAEARKNAKKTETKIIQEAKEEAARIKQRADVEISLERKRALDDMKREMIAVAAMMAGKVVSANIDTSIQASLVDETLKEMGESTWQS